MTYTRKCLKGLVVTYNSLLNRLTPTLKIHSWGGFGSQLYTLHLALQIRTKYPWRKLLVVIHSSGVTRRFSELDWNLFGIQASEINDFKKADIFSKEFNYKSVPNRIISLTKKVGSEALEIMRIVQTANSDKSLRNVKYWTMSLRGHYTKLTLNPEILYTIYSKLSLEPASTDVLESDLVIHYRLGDLLTLNQKSPIPHQRVDNLLKGMLKESNSCVVLTDSSQFDYQEFTRDSIFLKSLESRNLNPYETLSLCIRAKHFIGTGAKLTIWAAIFRQYVYGKQSHLPQELMWTKPSGVNSYWY